MAKSLTARYAMKVVVMLRMLIIVLIAIKAAAEIITSFIRRLERFLIPGVLAISLVIVVSIFTLRLLLAYLGILLNELA